MDESLALAAPLPVGNLSMTRPHTAPSEFMNATLNLPFVRAASAVRAYGNNLAQAACWMHPSWLTTLLDIDETQLERWKEALGRASDVAVERMSLALCCSAGVGMPSLETLSQPALRVRPEGVVPNSALLDACPVSVGLQILRMRAISFRRGEVRRLIDKQSRSQLSRWIGVGIDAFIYDAHPADAPDIARLHICGDMPLLATLDATAVGVEGLMLIERDTGTLDGTPCPLLRCALPRGLNVPAWCTGMSSELDLHGTAQLFARLPELIPEWSWLFG